MFSNIARRRRRSVERPVLNLQGFKKGLNTFDASNAVEKDELTRALNYYLNRQGFLKPRPGIVKFNTTVLDGKPYSIAPFKISGILYNIVCTDTNKVYKISLTGQVSLIGIVEGPANLFVYGDTCAVCDRSYIKYIDSSGTLCQSYDAGDDNGLYDKLDETATNAIKIYSGQKRAGVLITFPSFSSGFKIPLVEVKARVKKVGSPTGDLIARLFSGTTLLATSSTVVESSSLLVTEQTVDFLFSIDNSVQTSWMASNTNYRVVLEFDSGDAANCVELSQINDGEADGTNYTSAWVDSLYSPLMWLAPNLSPKASFGTTALKRPFFGGDVDNPGYVWYGNISIKDFSTPNGGGWIGVIDNNRTTYPVKGMSVLYGDLYVFGSADFPYLSKLTGTQPADYTLKDTYKGVSTEFKTIVSTANDLWFSNQVGTKRLRGVQEFGELRAYNQARSVLDRFSLNWANDNNNIAGYFKELGLYLLQIDGYDKVLACHTELPYQRSSTNGDISFPWTEFSFGETVTMLGQGSDFFIGMDNGYIYNFDFTALKDEAVDINFNWRTAFIEFPFSFVDLRLLRLIASSSGGLSFNLNIFTQQNETNAVQSIQVGVAQNGLLVEDATMLVEDADVLIDTGTNIPIYPINIRCTSIQLEGEGLERVFYSAVTLTGLLIQYKVLEV